MILLLVIAILVLTCIKPQWGLLVMLCCYLLMPEIPVDIVGHHFKKNHILMMVVIAYFLKLAIHSQRILYRPYLFCIIYLAISCLFIPFKSTSATSQLYYIIYDGAVVLLFPIALWNVIIRKGCNVVFRKTLIICIAIAGVYGLSLLFTYGINPWVMLFSMLEGEGSETWLRYYADDNRLFGRISSVFYHPMHFAAFLGFASLYIVYIKEKLAKKWFVVLFLILTVNILTCGVRSVIGALIVTALFYLLLNNNFGKTMKVVLVAAIILIVSLSIPGLDTYIASIFKGHSSSSIGGSSIEMRMNQLEGAFREINNNLLFGKGYGWSRDYIIQYGDHPVLLGFESILFVVLCNNGIVGLIVYALFGLLYINYVGHSVVRKERPYFICLLVYYYTYECITGEFAFQYFMLFYTFMLCENYYDKKYRRLTV